MPDEPTVRLGQHGEWCYDCLCYRCVNDDCGAAQRVADLCCDRHNRECGSMKPCQGFKEEARA